MRLLRHYLRAILRNICSRKPSIEIALGLQLEYNSSYSLWEGIPLNITGEVTDCSKISYLTTEIRVTCFQLPSQITSFQIVPIIVVTDFFIILLLTI